MHPKLQAINSCQVKRLGKDMPNSFWKCISIQRSQNCIWWPLHINSPAGICDHYQHYNSKVCPNGPRCTPATTNSKKERENGKCGSYLSWNSPPQNILRIKPTHPIPLFGVEGKDGILNCIAEICIPLSPQVLTSLLKNKTLAKSYHIKNEACQFILCSWTALWKTAITAKS